MGSSPREELSMSFKFGYRNLEVLRGFTKMGFSFILVGSNVLVVSYLIVCCFFLGTVLLI